VNARTFLILGGYGQTGRLIARFLLAESDAHLVLAGRNLERAEQLANQLNRDFAGQRARARKVDASSAQSLAAGLKAVDFLVVASSTARYARKVAVAALTAGVDYLDVQYSQEKIGVLKALAGDIERAGRCFITDAGFHPGLPAALVRYADGCFDHLLVAYVSSLIRVDWRELSLSPSTLEEFVSEMLEYEACFYKDGLWQKARLAGMLDSRNVDFGPPFGRQHVVPMMLAEMRSIPQMFSTLQQTGFYVSGFNWFVDWFVLPLSTFALWLSPRTALKPVSRLLFWGLQAFSRPPFGVILKVEARGEKDGILREIELSLCHPDGYVFTAVPVVACLLQYLDGCAKKPGLWMMGHLVDPDRLLHDMQRMGIEVKSSTIKGG
jgi:saccharopine dehydrogenase (NAD+, L-lysine-forming)